MWGQFCSARLVSKRQNRVQIRVAYIFLQTRLWICPWSENGVSVGFLGSPLLAGGASHGARLLAPVSFTIPKHAVCRAKKTVVLFSCTVLGMNAARSGFSSARRLSGHNPGTRPAEPGNAAVPPTLPIFMSSWKDYLESITSQDVKMGSLANTQR